MHREGQRHRKAAISGQTGTANPPNHAETATGAVNRLLGKLTAHWLVVGGKLTTIETPQGREPDAGTGLVAGLGL
jgi:hypothetical protein